MTCRLQNEIANWTAAGMAQRIRRREVSVELMTAVIRRIERRNLSLNALIFSDFPAALERHELPKPLSCPVQRLVRCMAFPQ